jgi:UDPglucose--hexose-1-phosphate uridylyltransferase
MTWEERYHPLRDEWVVLAAHRQHRPWQGHERSAPVARAPYEADCYLCPGNARVHGARNPEYTGLLAFDNDHPCVSERAPEPEPTLAPELFRARRASGAARIVCYSPRHDLTLAELAAVEIAALFAVWQHEIRELTKLSDVAHVQVFENKGEVVGVSNPHPHCQIYATSFVPKTIELELAACRAHHERSGRSLLGDIIAAERADGRRVLAENAGAIAFVPYFARYAYEVYVCPKEPCADFSELSSDTVAQLADVLKQVLVRYDNLWRMEFPYVLALHQAPSRGQHPGFHCHIELHPPLRKPHLLKHLAGPEIGHGCFIADTAPEATAAELLRVPLIHYKSG